MQEFIEELKYNQNINLEKGLENRVNIDYVIERLEDIKMQKEEKMILEPIYDSRASFYGKAIIEQTTNKNVEDFKLYSYGTLVARLTRIGNKSIYHYFGKYSCTTTRHQKEFFKQCGLNNKDIKELFDKGVLEIEL